MEPDIKPDVKPDIEPDIKPDWGLGAVASLLGEYPSLPTRGATRVRNPVAGAGFEPATFGL